jgi:hypothetical protein
MNKRIIKKENLTSNEKDIITVESGTQMMHPISLSWFNNKEKFPLCLTEYFYSDGKLQNFREGKCSNSASQGKYNKYMYLPPIGLTSDDLLRIYNIDSIDELISHVKNNTKKNYLNVNRIVNCWIRVNFQTLKNYNNSLEKIYLELLNNKKNSKLFNKIPNIEKEIKDFIDYWIGKHDGNEFELDLLDDFIFYLNKKFNK